MTKPEIKTRLTDNHELLIRYIDNLSESNYMYSLNGKWTAGQQMDHVFLSVQRLGKAMRFPKFFLRYKFGKANRPSKTYDALVNKYLDRLQAGGLAPSPFIPPAISFEEKATLQNKLQKTVEALAEQLDKFNEQQLDIYILPHPLLGILTLREMMYFTIYHAEHHMEIAKRNLVGRNS